MRRTGRTLALTLAVATFASCVSAPPPVPAPSYAPSRDDYLGPECVAACEDERRNCESAATGGHLLLTPLYVALFVVAVVGIALLVGGGGDCGGNGCGNGGTGHSVACDDAVRLCHQACMGRA